MNLRRCCALGLLLLAVSACGPIVPVMPTAAPPEMGTAVSGKVDRGTVPAPVEPTARPTDLLAPTSAVTPLASDSIAHALPTAAPNSTGVPAAPAAPPVESPGPAQNIVAATGEVALPLRINLEYYPDTLDPQRRTYYSDLATLRMIYEGLTRLNDKLETVPAAAESWTYNTAATELTFTLRPKLKYSDGTPLNARRFEYALIRHIDPATAGDYGSVTDDVLGAAEWRTALCETDVCTNAENEAHARLAATVRASVQALDAAGAPCAGYDQADCLTLKIRFARPAPYFHTIMSTWIAYPAKEENIVAGGEAWWVSSVYQTGNGPFVLAEVEPQVRQYFVPNRYYWNDHPQYTVEFRYIDDPALALQLYQNNELDIIASRDSLIETINADAVLKAQHRIYPGSCTVMFVFNTTAEFSAADGQTYPSPFQDQKVREAFFYAFDAERWVTEVDQGLSVPAATWIAPGYPGYDALDDHWTIVPPALLGMDPVRRVFDPERARAALAASSYGGPEKLNQLGLVLEFSDTSRNRRRFQWLAANYKQHLGVELVLRPQESMPGTYLSRSAAPLPLMMRLGWCPDYPDLRSWLSDFWQGSNKQLARFGYANPAFDELIAQADREPEPERRLQLYQTAQRLLMEDFPGIFAYHTTNPYLVKPWVKGIVPTPEDYEWPGSIMPAAISIDFAERASAVTAAVRPPLAMAPTAALPTLPAPPPVIVPATPLPVLRVNVGAYPRTLDPQLSLGEINEVATLRLIYEGLTRLNENLETVPAAAESWTYNAAATELTFTLRPNLKYSDGTPLNAKRFEYALIRNIDPETGSTHTGLTDVIVGAAEWHAADPFDDAYDVYTYRDAVGVRALEADGRPCGEYDYESASCLTVQLKFVRPAPDFHTLMSTWVAYPAKEENIIEGGALWWNSSVFQIGNGPFALEVVEPLVRQVLVPNPNYQGRQPRYTVEFRYISDRARAWQMYHNAELDIITTDQYLVKPWVQGIVPTPADGAWPGSLFPASITIEPQ